MFHYCPHFIGKKTKAWKLNNVFHFIGWQREALESLIPELRPAVTMPDWHDSHACVLALRVHRSIWAVGVCLPRSCFLSKSCICWQEESGALIPNWEIIVHLERGSWNAWSDTMETVLCLGESWCCRVFSSGCSHCVRGSCRPPCYTACLSLPPPHNFTGGRAPHLWNAQESRGHVGLHHQLRRSPEALDWFNVLIPHALSLCSLTSDFWPLLQWWEHPRASEHFCSLAVTGGKHIQCLPDEEGAVFSNYKDSNLISDCIELEGIIKPAVPDLERFYGTHRWGVTPHQVSKVCLGSSSDVGVASLWGEFRPCADSEGTWKWGVLWKGNLKLMLSHLHYCWGG